MSDGAPESPQPGGRPPNGNGNGGRGREALDAKIDSRRRAEMIGRLRRFSQGASGASPERGAAAEGSSSASEPEEQCDLCESSLASNHRHMVHLDDRRILCVCETCWSARSDEPELRPTGVRTVWLPDFELPDELWARFGIPIGLAFLMRDGRTQKLVALYPSPAGATESELELEAWDDLVELNPPLRDLEPDAEALVVDRISDGHRFVIAPIDECYKLVGMIKLYWEGISGGEGPQRAVDRFFEELGQREARA